jgi:deoxyinosine 3'endonuclease (endonuclease V)
MYWDSDWESRMIIGWGTAVFFTPYGDVEPATEFVHSISEVADYIPGECYKRELPCILAFLREMHGPYRVPTLLKRFDVLARRRIKYI